MTPSARYAPTRAVPKFTRAWTKGLVGAKQGAAQIDEALKDALVSACLLPDTGARNIDSLLNQQILPVLSQQLLQRQAAQQKTHGVTLGYSDDEGITLHFTDAQNAAQSAAMEA